MIQTIRINSTEIEAKPLLNSPTILLCPNLVKIGERKLERVDKILYLHAPNLEEIEKSGLYHNFSITCLNFPRLKMV